MNVLSASEIKKHGVMAIEKQLNLGPVHVLKHNHPLFVVLTEEDYKRLTSHKKPQVSGLFLMLSKTATGNLTRKEIDMQFKEERDEWDN